MQDGDDDDLLGGGEFQDNSASAEQTDDFESSFPAIDNSNKVRR